MTISTLTNEQLKYYANATCGGTRGDAGIMARELLAVREVQSLRGICVGNLPTMNQDEYPGLPDWWVQLRIGTDGDEVLARIYGSTPHEAMMRARAIAAPPAPAVSADVAAALDWIDDFIARCNGDDRGACNSVNVLRAVMLQPVSQGYTLPDVLKSLERLIGVANTVNHAKQHEISIDDDPCYWQRQEWVEYLLEESKKAEETYRAAMLVNDVTDGKPVAGNSPVIPDGWKLVPAEPTPKQWAAGIKAMDEGIDKVTLIYRAMVAEAPKPYGEDL